MQSLKVRLHTGYNASVLFRPTRFRDILIKNGDNVIGVNLSSAHKNSESIELSNRMCVTPLIP